MEPEAEVVPRVTPFLLREAAAMCPRRLALEYERAPATADPVNRARVRDALLDAVRTWHSTGAWPLTAGLVAEERSVVAHACRWYQELFPEPVAEAKLPLTEPTLLPRRGLLLGGWADLGVTHTDGTHELRQLTWSGPPAPRDPLELPAVRLAVLRLAHLGWSSGQPITVTFADLLGGTVAHTRVELPAGLTPLAAWLDQRVAVLRARADPTITEPGASCWTCRFVPRCPAHGVQASMLTRRDALVPGILSISPTSLDSWHRCRREWRDRALLGLPASNPVKSTEHGLFLHRLLHLVHRGGSCHDDGHVADVLASHAADARTEDEVKRHARRCPLGARAVGHEVEWTRAHPAPPVFLATARIDAAWEHDGILDLRDYKTGRVAPHPLSEDRRARLQAWVAAPQAAARGLRIRLRYEHLATEVRDDPEPWEPSDEDLAAIEVELATAVDSMLAEREFRGVADVKVCERCSYRSVCEDSAAPDAPTWPEPGPVARSGHG